jgi:tetratricopeptide (TPR) repeat protein
MKRFTLTVLAAVPLLLLLGCSSAQRQYERGMELEVQGRFAEAARYYAQAIRRDPDLNTMVRGRLRESGRQAIEAFVADARHHHREDRHVDAADRYREADAVLEIGRSVGERIVVPAHYDEDRRAAFDRAIATLLADGDGARAHGEFEAGIAHYQRALRYDPDRDQSAELHDAIAVTRVDWSGWLVDHGHYRLAFEIAAAGLAAPGRFAADFRRLQDEALARGSTRLAALPIQRLSGNLPDLPQRFPEELSLLLDDEFWIQPPLFIQTADPRDVRTLARRRLVRDVAVGNPRLAADLGRSLGAEFVLAGGIDRFARSTGEERATDRTVRRRRGEGNATYTEIRTPTTFRAAVRIEVIDVATRRVVCSDRVERAVDGPVLRAEFRGNPTDLDLTRDQRALFTAEGIEDQERRLHDRLAEQLAAAVAERAYHCVLSRIP